MAIQELDSYIKKELDDRARKLEEHFEGDVVYYTGTLSELLIEGFREYLEAVKAHNNKHERLVFFLRTDGGSAETVEKLVEIMRFHYQEVFFVVPERAMSAGTIFCMSGDKIYMDYSSSLGPIDPQVFNGTQWVPALGYLDQVERLIQKAADKSLTDAEMLILQNQDLAMLSRYEQAKNLTITLLKQWLVEYKFKDWTTHKTSPEKKGLPVKMEEKQARAEEIANLLSNNKLWHSHGRMISLATIQRVLKLRVEDYSKDAILRPMIRSYNDFFMDYVNKNGFPSYIHCRHA